MFSAISQPAVSNSLLTEVANSGAFPDPALFVYGVLSALVVASLILAYAIFGRSVGRAPRAESPATRTVEAPAEATRAHLLLRRFFPLL